MSVQNFLSFHLTFSSILVTMPNLFFLVFMVAKSGEIFKKQQRDILLKLTEKASNDSRVRNRFISKNFMKRDFLFQVKSFALQIHQQKIEFKVFKIVTLNHAYLFEILTVVCSYFVVLLQYEMTSRE